MSSILTSSTTREESAMRDDRAGPRTPHILDAARADAESRLAREAAALRANLHRRKQQARARAAVDADKGDADNGEADNREADPARPPQTGPCPD